MPHWASDWSANIWQLGHDTSEKWVKVKLVSLLRCRLKQRGATFLLWRSMDSFSATFSRLTTGRKRVFADKLLSSMPNMGNHGNLLLTKSQRGTIFPIQHIFPQWPEFASGLSGSHDLLFRLLWLSWIRHQIPYHFSYTKQTPNLNQPSVSRQKNLEDFLLCEFILPPREVTDKHGAAHQEAFVHFVIRL